MLAVKMITHKQKINLDGQNLMHSIVQLCMPLPNDWHQNLINSPLAQDALLTKLWWKCMENASVHTIDITETTSRWDGRMTWEYNASSTALQC